MGFEAEGDGHRCAHTTDFAVGHVNFDEHHFERRNFKQHLSLPHWLSFGATKISTHDDTRQRRAHFEHFDFAFHERQLLTRAFGFKRGHLRGGEVRAFRGAHCAVTLF